MQNIIRLTDKNMIINKNLIVLGGKRNYLDELRSFCTEAIDAIRLIVSNNTNEPDNRAYEDRSIPIISIDDFDLSSLSENDLVLILDDYYKEYYEALVYRYGKDYDRTIYWYPSKESAIELVYREKYANAPLKNIIVFRSGPHASEYVDGMDFADNARALFEYMISNGLDEKYQLVWIVKKPARFADKYSSQPNVKFISWDWSMTEDKAKRDEYYRVLCLAKYFFFTDAYGFTRNCRKDQVRVQLWHGCGFKTRTNFVPCRHRYEYNIVVSQMYKKIHEDIYGLDEKQVLITGYPKEDCLFDEADSSLLRRLNIPEKKRLIAWLPTFRSTGGKLALLDQYDMEGETGLPILDCWEKLDALNSFLQEHDAILLVKLHPFQKELRGVKVYSNIIFLSNEKLLAQDVAINQLLPLAEALISDYSSVAVDYLQLDRPIAFLVDDIEEYEKSRGFVFSPIADWLPGVVVKDQEGLEDFISQVCAGADPGQKIRKSLYPKFHDYHDGGSCRRVVEQIIKL